jgi:hypothetical protein
VQIDDEAIALLRQQIEAAVAQTAELRRQNDLAEQAIKQSQADAQSRELADRNREIAERNRIKLALNTNEKVAGIAEALPGVFLAIYGMQEWQKEDSRWKDRVDDILLLLLTGRGNGNKARVTELKEELEREHYQRLLSQEDFNLQQLEEQVAAHGGLVNAPVKLHNDIRKTKQRIEELQEKLAD